MLNETNNTGDISPTVSNYNVPETKEELRVSYLEANISTRYEFRTRSHFYQYWEFFLLRELRDDHKLQIKSFIKCENGKKMAWPISATLVINGTNIPVPSKDVRKPLYVEEHLSFHNWIYMRNRHRIKEYFVEVNLIWRPTVLIAVKCTPALSHQDAVEFILNLFREENIKIFGKAPKLTALRVSLFCPVSKERISIPARLKSCSHLQCFDLEHFLSEDLDWNSWKCKICKLPGNLYDLVVDPIFLSVVKNFAGSKVKEVIVDDTLQWLPLRDSFQCESEGNDELSLRIACPRNNIMKDFWFLIKNVWTQLKFSISNPQLKSRPDLEVELQCYLDGCPIDHESNPVCFCINDIIIDVNWKNGIEIHSVDIKAYLRTGNNEIIIMTSNNCVHTVTLCLVHRPTLQSFRQLLLTKRYNSFEKCLFKVHQFMTQRKLRALSLPILCPISGKRMEYPVKLKNCRHITCFDLLSFFRFTRDFRKQFTCPICGIVDENRQFELDDFMIQALRQTSENNTSVIVKMVLLRFAS